MSEKTEKATSMFPNGIFLVNYRKPLQGRIRNKLLCEGKNKLENCLYFISQRMTTSPII